MSLIDFIFPKNCLGCGDGGSHVCISCVSKLSILKPICPECEKLSVDGFTHVKCRRKLSLDGLISLWQYEGVIRTALLKLKYKFATEIADELSELICEKLKDGKVILPKGPILVPVPMYWLKENFRGFNQSEKMGEMISEKMGWNYYPDLLVRKRLKKPQTQLKGDERKQNIRGVFAFNPSNKLPACAGRLATSYILFDDVYTTGSTLKEAAKVLKRNGAKQVWGLTIAR